MSNDEAKVDAAKTTPTIIPAVISKVINYVNTRSLKNTSNLSESDCEQRAPSATGNEILQPVRSKVISEESSVSSKNAFKSLLGIVSGNFDILRRMTLLPKTIVSSRMLS